MVYPFSILLSLLVLMGLSGSRVEPPARVHDFHVSYGQMAVEGNVVVYRVRFFRDDLTEGLQQFHGQPSIHLDVSPRIDSLFTAYFNATFVLEVEGQRLQGAIAGSGEEQMGKQQMWWYAMQFEASEPLRTFTITNRLLLERFADQKNILKVRHFPSEKQLSYYFAEGAEQYTISF